ncbi:Cytoskeleton protein RodZ [hydrothermal vent metagenome]|uniref:Cytoskeleton protein RodZ n=1 Tax=hydrothermal vent metagenome TaxID=652676 RepID=A0A3B0YJV1_9ZZZZ
MVDNDTAPVADNALAAIGKRLAKAREDAGKDHKAVATELHLRVEIIKALETGDETALPAAAFVRGYVRSYARFVGLDDVALVASLPQAMEHQPVPRRAALQRNRLPSIPLGRVLVWGLVLLVLAFVLLYGAPAVERLWSGQNSLPVDNTLQLPQSGMSGELPESDRGESHKLPGFLPELSTEEPEPVQTVAKPIAVKEPVVTSAVSTTDAKGPAELTLRFSGDSWVEMKSRDRKLVMGTQRAGTERTVRAEPPIDILLGNAPAVEMTWRGKPFDITPYQRGKVARIKLEH